MKSSGIVLCFIPFWMACGASAPPEGKDAIIEGIEAFDEGGLDYGFYWYDGNNESRKAYDEEEREVLPVEERFYDPSRPTVLQFHGWQPFNGVLGGQREAFNFVHGREIDMVTIQSWKDAGWNVGVFFWNQFADELEVKNAEAKIHTATGPQGMRYSTGDGFESEDAPGRSLASLAFSQFKALLEDNTSGEIRFVGHSLGSQMATELAYRIGQAVQLRLLPERLMPGRLDLLDPFWSQGPKEYLRGKTPAERALDRVEDLISDHDLAVTIYKSSELNEIHLGDSNEPLQARVAVIRHRYRYLNPVRVSRRHVYVRHHYFWSFAFDPPTLVYDASRIAPSASTPTEQIKEMMRSEFEWEHIEGRRTVSPGDDRFELKPRN